MKRTIIRVGSASDEELLKNLRRFERKYGCRYMEFLSRGDFDHRSSDEWLDELPWRLLEEELTERISQRMQPVSFPIRVQAEA